MNQLPCLFLDLLNRSGLRINRISLLFWLHPSTLSSSCQVKIQVFTWTTRNCMIWHSVLSDPLPSPFLPHSACSHISPLTFLVTYVFQPLDLWTYSFHCLEHSSLNYCLHQMPLLWDVLSKRSSLTTFSKIASLIFVSLPYFNFLHLLLPPLERKVSLWQLLLLLDPEAIRPSALLITLHFWYTKISILV